jgi:hypothetical protein
MATATMDFHAPYEAILKAHPECLDIRVVTSLPYCVDPTYTNAVMIIYLTWYSPIYYDQKEFFVIQIYKDGTWRKNDTPDEIIALIRSFLPHKCVDDTTAVATTPKEETNAVATAANPEGLKPQETW